MCTLLDLNQSNKIGVYIIPTILISFCSNKIDVYIMRQIKKLTWLQVCFLGDVGVIWCNSLSDSLFQIYVMNFVEIVIDSYLHITSHVSQVFASCTHYTNYSLLNFCICYCVWFWFGQLSLKIPWILCKMCLKPENLRIIVWKS